MAAHNNPSVTLYTNLTYCPCLYFFEDPERWQILYWWLSEKVFFYFKSNEITPIQVVKEVLSFLGQRIVYKF